MVDGNTPNKRVENSDLSSNLNHGVNWPCTFVSTGNTLAKSHIFGVVRGSVSRTTLITQGQQAITNTETEMSSFWWNFHHWLHWKLSKWQLPVQPMMKISSKWRHFRFSEAPCVILDAQFEACHTQTKSQQTAHLRSECPKHVKIYSHNCFFRVWCFSHSSIWYDKSLIKLRIPHCRGKEAQWSICSNLLISCKLCKSMCVCYYFMLYPVE